MEGDGRDNSTCKSYIEAATPLLEAISTISQPSQTPLSKTSSESTRSDSSEGEPKAAPLPLASLHTGARKSAVSVASEAESKHPILPSPRAFSHALFPSFPLHPSQAPLLVTPIASMAAVSPSIDTRALDNGKLETLGESEADGDRTEREHKKRSKNWTRQETLKLIKLRTERQPRFSKSGRKTDLWDEIAESMRKESFVRDAQQCRDKWEKLSARYKEVRDGLKDRGDNPFFEELHGLLADRSVKKERERKEGLGREEVAEAEGGGIAGEMKRTGERERTAGAAGDDWEDEDREEMETTTPPARKKRKGSHQFSAFTQLDVVQSLLESVISKQQKLFEDLLDATEKKEQRREQERQEREALWRAEERAQRCVLNNAMILLTQKLVRERKDAQGAPPGAVSAPISSPQRTQAAHKKRSKNWKRSEVSHLIKARGILERRFASSARRTGLWEEVAELLSAEGISRGAKQCREKWDKLMAAYKDMGDGKRERGDSPYFTELSAIIGSRLAEKIEQRPP